jgi:hypothetical protein
MPIAISATELIPRTRMLVQNVQEKALEIIGPAVKIEAVDSCEKAFGVLTYKTARYHKLSGNPHSVYILIQLCFISIKYLTYYARISNNINSSIPEKAFLAGTV